MDSFKVSDHQLFAMTGLISLGGSILVISAAVSGVAKQDAWLSALVTLIAGVLIIWMYGSLGSGYRDLTIIGIAHKLLGKWFGVLVSGIILSMPLTLSYHIPWYISAYTRRLMHETPVEVISAVFVTAMIIAVLYGLEAIARAAEIFVKYVTVLFVLSSVLVLPNARTENLLPVLETGVVPVLKGSVLLSGFITFEIIPMLMIYPVRCVGVEGGKKQLIKGFLWSGLILFTTVFLSILVLGFNITAKSTAPTILLAREINVGMILSRLEYVIAVIWTITQFFASTLFFYTGIIGISEFLGLRDYRKIAVPMGMLMLVLSGIVFPDDLYRIDWVNTVWIPYIFTVGLALPLLLFIVSLIKRLVLKKT